MNIAAARKPCAVAAWSNERCNGCPHTVKKAPLRGRFFFCMNILTKSGKLYRSSPDSSELGIGGEPLNNPEQSPDTGKNNSLA
jgi:hypothetical protein